MTKKQLPAGQSCALTFLFGICRVPVCGLSCFPNAGTSAMENLEQ